MRIEPDQATVLEAFSAVNNATVFAESRSLVERGLMPVEMLRAMAASPGMLQAFAALCDVIYPGGTLSRDVQELVILTASQKNACQFCHASHLDIARMVGVSCDPALLLNDPSQRTAQQDLAQKYTLQLMQDSNAVSDALFESVRASFGDAGAVELTMLVGYINTLNMFNNALQNRYHGELGEQGGAK
jgi:AhpD family alkylhydroperoxidase